jgi:hypothetical protein
MTQEKRIQAKNLTTLLHHFSFTPETIKKKCKNGELKITFISPTSLPQDTTTLFLKNKTKVENIKSGIYSLRIYNDKKKQFHLLFLNKNGKLMSLTSNFY